MLYGSGFEDHPDWLPALAGKRVLLGNPADVVNRVKQPGELAALLAALGIPHPEIRRQPPATAGWLCKRAGAAGGAHVRPAAEGQAAGPDDYFQRRIDGRALSTTVLANGRRALILGCCETWCDASDPARRYRYGGAATLLPGALPAMLRYRLAAAASALTAACGLRGLIGLDWIIAGAEPWLLEVNPRPTATTGLHGPGAGLLALHRAALTGVLPERPPPVPAGSRAHAVIYATRALRTRTIRWPPWVSDRPWPGSLIAAGEPVCSISACGADPVAARAALQRRRNRFLETLTLWQQH